MKEEPQEKNLNLQTWYSVSKTATLVKWLEEDQSTLASSRSQFLSIILDNLFNSVILHFRPFTSTEEAKDYLEDKRFMKPSGIKRMSFKVEEAVTQEKMSSFFEEQAVTEAILKTGAALDKEGKVVKKKKSV